MGKKAQKKNTSNHHTFVIMGEGENVIDYAVTELAAKDKALSELDYSDNEQIAIYKLYQVFEKKINQII